MSKKQEDKERRIKEKEEQRRIKEELNDPSAYIPHFTIPMLLALDSVRRGTKKTHLQFFVMITLASNPMGLTVRNLSHVNKADDDRVYDIIKDMRLKGLVANTGDGVVGRKSRRVYHFLTKAGEQELIKQLKALNKEIKRYKSLYDAERKHIWNSVRNPDRATAKSYGWVQTRKVKTEVLQSPDTEDI